MKNRNNKIDVFAQFIRLLISGSGIIVLGAIVMLIYLPFSVSINDSFKPSSKPMEGNFSSNAMGTYDEDKVVNGIHQTTGMIYDKNFSIVKNACTSCHSAKLITQNRATRDGWKQMIRWMQATQGLPDLGKSEGKILDYLAKNYAPTNEGRRSILKTEEIEWYTLDVN